jgi:ketosteroid isomerase-like protein
VVPAIVERYRAALEQRDVAALHDIWPGLGGAQEAAIRADFDNARSIEVAITGLNVEVSGTSATATGLRRYVVHTRDGHRLQSDTVTTILLRKVGPRWVIDSMRHQPVR